ncbi:DegT/DnrJ/EryC1/StrS family aminotransferase [Patescibacteria group bacterium]
MSKFDLVEKLRINDILSAFIGKDSKNPDSILRSSFLTRNLKPYYFNWGRNALYYLFKNLKYQEIVFPSFTCPTLIQVAQKAGKKVILTEIDLETFNLDINKIPSNTKCLVVVHTFGNPVDIKKIKDRFPKIYVIEDCAHALFSRRKKAFAGNVGDSILFSLYKQVPNINGSLLLSGINLKNNGGRESDFKYLKRLLFKTHGFHHHLLDLKRQKYLPKIEPFKLADNLPSKLALKLFSIGFKNLRSEIKKRRKICKWYFEECKKSPYLTAQKPEKNSSPSCYQFAVRLDPKLKRIREKLVTRLRKESIFIDRLWYQAPICLEEHSSYVKNCPNAYLLANTVINLPIYSSYTRKDVKFLFKRLNSQILSIVK